MLLSWRELTSYHNVSAEAQDLTAHMILACGKYKVIQPTIFIKGKAVSFFKISYISSLLALVFWEDWPQIIIFF